jgi:hypothetical protein
MLVTVAVACQEGRTREIELGVVVFATFYGVPCQVLADTLSNPVFSGYVEFGGNDALCSSDPGCHPFTGSTISLSNALMSVTATGALAPVPGLDLYGSNATDNSYVGGALTLTLSDDRQRPGGSRARHRSSIGELVLFRNSVFSHRVPF